MEGDLTSEAYNTGHALCRRHPRKCGRLLVMGYAPGQLLCSLQFVRPLGGEHNPVALLDLHGEDAKQALCADFTVIPAKKQLTLELGCAADDLYCSLVRYTPGIWTITSFRTIAAPPIIL